MRTNTVRDFLPHWIVVPAIAIPLVLLAMLQAYSIHVTRRGPLRNSVSGKFGKADPVKPTYAAHVACERFVRQAEANTFNPEARFDVAPEARTYVQGPIYGIRIDERFSMPSRLPLRGNFEPGVYVNNVFVPRNWEKKMERSAAFWEATSPSRRYNFDNERRPPRSGVPASNKWTITPLVAGTQPAEVTVRLVATRSDDRTVAATVYPRISPAYEVRNIRANRIGTALYEILWTLNVYASPPPSGKVEILSVSRQLIKTVRPMGLLQTTGPGEYNFRDVWDMTNNSGAPVPSGQYIVRITITGGGITVIGTKAPVGGFVR